MAALFLALSALALCALQLLKKCSTLCNPPFILNLALILLFSLKLSHARARLALPVRRRAAAAAAGGWWALLLLTPLPPLPSC
eukprot:6214358-Pleurochrysis_carterae.AAC.3